MDAATKERSVKRQLDNQTKGAHAQKPEMVPKSCSFFAYLTTTLLVFGSYYLAKHFHSHLPPPITKTSPNVFVSSRARTSLDKLANFGPRPTGSYSNEVAAVQLLLDILNSTKTFATNKNIEFQFEVQKVSGSFQLSSFLDGFVQSYDGVQNVVARLSAKHDRQDKTAILVNAHFDSVPQGPGASDDAISCAVILEVIRVIVNSPDINLHNDVIFLMNGAEETILAASHGFITQHRWSKDILAFINLEAAGSGGKEQLFQSGPGNSWLLQAYIDAAPHPFASVVGQEVFQSGIIPSDTDFRIFRDYGHVPGLDIAFIQNGYVYHTDHDTSARIPDGSIQRAGDNVLAVLTNLAEKENLGDDSSNQTSVFFDLLGICMVEYPSWVGVCLNVLLAVLAFGAVFVDVELCVKKMDVRKGECFRAILVCVLSDVLVIVISVACSTLTGFVLGVSGFSMSWFYRTSLLFFLYSVPTLAVIFAVLSKVKGFLLNTRNWAGAIEIFYFDGVLILFGIISLLLTICGVNSAFIFSLSLTFNLGWWVIVRLFSTKFSPNTWSSFMFYILVQVLPLTFWSYVIQIVFTVFLPIMGRRGSEKNPDIMMGLMTSFLLIILIQFIFPIIISMKKQVWVTVSLIVVFIITLLLILLTSVGFPYSGDPRYPSQQRINILHTRRSFFNPDGSVNSTDSGYLTLRADYHWASALLKAVPEYKSCHVVDDVDCDARLGCGFPQNRFKLRGGKNNLWVAAPEPILKHLPPLYLQLTSVKSQGWDDQQLHNVSIEVSGPSRVVLLMSPHHPVHIHSWSFSEEMSDGAEWREGRLTYYVQFIQGLNQRPRQFWMLVSGWRRGMELMEVSVAGHYDHGQGKIGPGQSDFVDKHPTWTSTSAWAVDYKYYLLRP